MPQNVLDAIAFGLTVFNLVTWEWSLYLDGLRSQIEDDDPPPGGTKCRFQWPSLLGHFCFSGAK